MTQDNTPAPPAYAELQCLSNFSFHQGASHPDELALTAAALGHRAIGLADRNTLAGLVRAHTAAKQADIKFLPGVRLDLLSAPTWHWSSGTYDWQTRLPKDLALQGGLEVNVPDADAPPLELRDPLVVTITVESEVFVSESRVPVDGLESTFDRLFDDGRQGIIRVDDTAPAGLLLRVNQAIANGGGEPSIATETVARPPESGR